MDPKLRPWSPPFELDHRVVSVHGSAARHKPHSRHPEPLEVAGKRRCVTVFLEGGGSVCRPGIITPYPRTWGRGAGARCGCRISRVSSFVANRLTTRRFPSTMRRDQGEVRHQLFFCLVIVLLLNKILGIFSSPSGTRKDRQIHAPRRAAKHNRQIRKRDPRTG